MKLYVVKISSWGTSINVVRAASRELAIEAVVGYDYKRNVRTDIIEVTELEPDKEGILWCWDYSPDS